MGFHWSLNDSKSSQVSWTLLSILAYNAIIRMVTICPLISNSSNPLTKPMRIILSAPVTIGITATFMFIAFLHLWQGLYTCLSFCLLWCSFCDLPGWQSPQYSRFSFFLFTITKSDHLAGIRWFVCISNSREFSVSHSLGWILVYAYTIL